MTLALGAAYAAVRAIDPDGGPSLPPSWSRRQEGATGWWSFRTPQGDLLVALRANAIGGDGLFAVWGPTARLEEIAAGKDDVMPGREALRRGYDLQGGAFAAGIDSGTVLGGSQEATARQMVRAWPWWRCDVFEDHGEGPVLLQGVRRRLCSDGFLLPNLNLSSLPWDLDEDGNEVAAGSAVRRVVRLFVPTTLRTLGGFDSPTVLEDEPDRAPP